MEDLIQLLLVASIISFLIYRSNKKKEAQSKIRRDNIAARFQNEAQNQKNKLKKYVSRVDAAILKVKESRNLADEVVSKESMATLQLDLNFSKFFNDNKTAIEANFSDDELLKLVRVNKYINVQGEEFTTLRGELIKWQQQVKREIKNYKPPIVKTYDLNHDRETPLLEKKEKFDGIRNRYLSSLEGLSNYKTVIESLDALATSMVLMRIANDKIGFFVLLDKFDELGVFFDGYQKLSVKFLEDINKNLSHINRSMTVISSSLYSISDDLNTIGDTLKQIESGIIDISFSNAEISKQVAFGNLINTIGLIQTRKLLKSDRR